TGKLMKRIPFEIPAIGEDGPRPGASSVPMMIKLDPAGKLAYVGLSHSGLVATIDLERAEVAGYYKGGTKPEPLEIYSKSPDRIASPSYLAQKSPRLGGHARGWYEGVARGQPFRLPRRVDPARDGIGLAAARPVIYSTRGRAAGSMDFEREFLPFIESAIPEE